MRSYLQFAILLPLVLCGACATPPYQPLPGTARDIISSTDVVLPSKQNEIYVFVPNSNVAAATGGGLIPALIDAGINSVRTSKAETAVKPLRDSLVDFNFDEALGGELKSSLSEVSWMHVGNVRVIKEVTSDATDRAVTESRAGAVLFATPDYRLSNDGDELFLSVNVSLFPNDDALRALKGDKAKAASSSTRAGSKTAQEIALYRNTLKFKARAPGATSDRDRNVAAWSADNGAAMRSILKLGAAKVALMLADDLQSSPEEIAANTKTYVMGPGQVTIEGITGRIVGTDDDGETVRLNDGTMAFVTKAALER